MKSHQGDEVQCPDCRQKVPKLKLRQHIGECEEYVPTYINNVARFLQHMDSNYIHFLAAEMDIIREQLQHKIQEERKNGIYPSVVVQDPSAVRKQQKSPKPKQQKKLNGDIANHKQAQITAQPPRLQQTLNLQDNFDYLFPNAKPEQPDTIECVYPGCRQEVSVNDFDKFTYLDECLHTVCLACARKHFTATFVKEGGTVKCPSAACRANVPLLQVRQIIGDKQLQRIEEQLNQDAFIVVECQKCRQKYQFEEGRPQDAPRKTSQGREVGPSACKHYAAHRFQCPKCNTDQCRSCKTVPYHLGFSCQDFAQYKLRKKCRYCKTVLEKDYKNDTGIQAFDDICGSDACSDLTRQACSSIHPCGHPCLGYIRQRNCLPCLKEECAEKQKKELHGQDEASFCSMCYVEALVEAPCVRGRCGHIFHYKCLKKRLELKWEGARILFTFCQCPLCQQWIQLPVENPLYKKMRDFRALKDTIEEKALKRLKYEGNDKDEKLLDAKSSFYKNEPKYAMAIYAYFMCHGCKMPYFGGKRSCAEAMAPQDQQYDPKELLCAACCPINTVNCPRHGKQYVSFKCRFCCSVAQWFCWGNTHFCDACHKRQTNGQYVSRIPKSELPKCPGEQRCPSGGHHPANGEEFCLGCGLCRGERGGIKDF